jgi:outer membrane protein assembly factor BamD
LLRYTRKFWLVIMATTLLGGCLGKKKAAPIAGTSAEPDKVLYGKATEDIKHGRYTVGRLGLQTLINTYPDSEYLAKAKLAIGDSYYKEGGTAGLKQSIVEYKDFITFFPFLDEAPYAQLQVGMAHYRQMEKPDRDHSEAVQAEAEFQTFLEKYPSSPLLPQAQQRLREIQEVLAEGNFGVARFYFIRGGYRAAGARLIELTTRYPLYSQADQANWMLGEIYEKTEHNEIAARYYSRIVKDYPLSSLVGDAKNKLTKFGVPIPPADPEAVARMQKEEASSNRPGFVGRSISFVRTKPDVSSASHTGEPTMTPSGESGDETLSFGPAPTATLGTGSAAGNTATVETVTPGSPTSLAPPEASSPDPTPASTDTPQPSGTAPDSSTTEPASATSPAAPADKSQESTSKKKKGIHKILPF